MGGRGGSTKSKHAVKVSHASHKVFAPSAPVQRASNESAKNYIEQMKALLKKGR